MIQLQHWFISGQSELCLTYAVTLPLFSSTFVSWGDPVWQTEPETPTLNCCKLSKLSTLTKTTISDQDCMRFWDSHSRIHLLSASSINETMEKPTVKERWHQFDKYKTKYCHIIIMQTDVHVWILLTHGTNMQHSKCSFIISVWRREQDSSWWKRSILQKHKVFFKPFFPCLILFSQKVLQRISDK